VLRVVTLVLPEAVLRTVVPVLPEAVLRVRLSLPEAVLRTVRSERVTPAEDAGCEARATRVLVLPKVLRVCGEAVEAERVAVPVAVRPAVLLRVVAEGAAVRS